MSFLANLFRRQPSPPMASILNRGEQFTVTVDGARFDGECVWGSRYDKKLMLIAESVCRVPKTGKLTLAERVAIAETAKTALLAQGKVGCPVVVV